MGTVDGHRAALAACRHRAVPLLFWHAGRVIAARLAGAGKAGVIDIDRTFTVASDVSLVELIRRASRRLVVVSPALSDLVAAALADRFRDLGQLTIAVVLDADPEVYRLGYGTTSALEKLRGASEQNHFDLRTQPGVRMGIVISDDVTMLFAPVPTLIRQTERNHFDRKDH